MNKDTLKVVCTCNGVKPKYLNVSKDIVKTVLKMSKGVRDAQIPVLLEGLKDNSLVALIIPLEKTIKLSFPSPTVIAWRFLENLTLHKEVSPPTGDEGPRLFFVLKETK
jgi:hypothetical protein